ncbi:MAG: hypothetical protein O7G88_17660 [bacterium]|nr:hypothetical protein [bacterium]
MEMVVTGTLAEASSLLQSENFIRAIIALIDENGYEVQIYLEDVNVQGHAKG